MTENPAETMRRAVALMRERAEKATGLRWVQRGGCGGLDTVVAVPPDGGPAEWAQDVAFCESADAEHIASWCPLVALAVAGWLKTVADAAALEMTFDIPECAHDEACRCDHTPAWCCNRCAGRLGADCHCWDDPVAVARAYLGAVTS